MKIRAARADDPPAGIAELIYSAGPAIYDFIYATRDSSALAYIRHEFASGRGFTGHRNVTVADKEGQVVATGCFYDGKAYNTLMMGSLGNMFRFYGPIKVWPVLLRAHQVESIIAKPVAGELYLSNFGVAPTERGTGIGSAMIQLKVAQARQAGHRIFSLDVADNNPRAEALYARLGLKVTQFKLFSGHRAGISVPNAKKMELVL
jgi:ribosomal protein S18 acetylase RimI-like enzyme